MLRCPSNIQSAGQRFLRLFVRPLPTRRIHEHRVRRQFLEAQIDRPANRAGSMNRSCGNGDSLPRTEPQLGTALKIDGQRPFDDEERSDTAAASEARSTTCNGANRIGSFA
jgi:hypothetical protein